MEHRNGRKFNLSKLSDEELLQLMESVEIDENGSDFNSDDELDDRDYMPDEISPEDEHAVSACIREMNEATDSFILITDMSLHISSIDDIPVGSSTLTEIPEASSSTAAR
uniref:UDP-N-acetylglucosamine--N-acetylmuramyl-(Pentapeptide) pyrophosphoryl-undecaprenol N-acetylglucosamine transferase n=1 Tax=Zeugodacus cucurbitae TaxID=28588 RepID=A0A0A1WM12_ZEUCU